MMQDVEIPGDKEEEIYSESELVNEEEEANWDTASYDTVKMKGHRALILSIVQESDGSVKCFRTRRMFLERPSLFLQCTVYNTYHRHLVHWIVEPLFLKGKRHCGIGCGELGKYNHV